MRVNVLGPIRHMISIGNSTVSRAIKYLHEVLLLTKGGLFSS